jgi:very-short-patch-repair endonuclease
MTDPDRLRQFARAMRKDPTPAERILWRLVRHRRLAGYRFRRQHPFGPYILDFYCPVAALVVELDGDTHAGREECDQARDVFLSERGLFTLRVPNDWLYTDGDAVLERVARTCAERAAANPLVSHKLDAAGRFRPADAR